VPTGTSASAGAPPLKSLVGVPRFMSFTCISAQRPGYWRSSVTGFWPGRVTQKTSISYCTACGSVSFISTSKGMVPSAVGWNS
jgi:hypothetical protein